MFVSAMKKRITLGISFPDETILEKARERAKELGIRSFSDYINQLIKYDLGMPNYIGQYIGKTTKDVANAKEYLSQKGITPNENDTLDKLQ